MSYARNYVVENTGRAPGPPNRIRNSRLSPAIITPRAHCMRARVAVLDSRTGTVWAAGAPYQDFASASVVKTMIAMRALLTGRMTGIRPYSHAR